MRTTAEGKKFKEKQLNHRVKWRCRRQQRRRTEEKHKCVYTWICEYLICVHRVNRVHITRTKAVSKEAKREENAIPTGDTRMCVHD